MTERSPETRRSWQVAAIVAMGSLALSGYTVAMADKASEFRPQSDTVQSTEAPQSTPQRCESPIALETNENNYVDPTFANSVREAQEAAKNEAELSDMLREVFRKETKTNPMFLAAEAFQMGLATKEQFSNAKSALVKEGCLSEQGEIVYELYSTALDDYNFEIVELSGDYYTTGVDMDGNLFIDPRVGVMGGSSAVRKVPKSKEIALETGLKEHYTSCICANSEIFAGRDISGIPQKFIPQRPGVPQWPTPEEPQPKGNAGVKSPEGTWGEVNWDSSGYGDIGPETAVPAGPQVRDEGSSEWTYTPPASPQVAPGAPSNTAVAPGAEPAPAAPAPAPVPAITNEGIRLPGNQENDGDIDPGGN